MLTVFSADHRLHHGVELKDGAVTPSFENPLRADTVLARVEASGLGKVTAPHAYSPDHYVGAHSRRYIAFLESAWTQWRETQREGQALPLVWPVRGLRDDREPLHIDGKLGFYSMDAGSPINAGTWDAARAAANSALTGIDQLNAGAGGVFALCRPPGHHAGHEYAGGYCYLNNAAIAAQHALARGAGRVAILDVDFHHGNGTQDIFYARRDVFFASIHGDPSVSYPYFAGHADERGTGDGEGFNLNLPLPKGTTFATYRNALDRALDAIARFAPHQLVVSLGVDTFEHDPISHFRLKTADYPLIGARIAALKLPTLFVMEGGYMVDEIGVNAVNVLSGFDGA